MRNRASRSSRPFAAAALATLAACSSMRVETWVEGGTTLGTVRIETDRDGFVYRYFDTAAQLRRIEHRNDEHGLYHREELLYDDVGRVREHRCFDREGKPTDRLRGYVILRRFDSKAANGDDVATWHWLDEGEVPRDNPEGFARRVEVTRAERPHSLEYFRADGGRAAVRVDDIAGVHRIDYAYLQGASNVVMAVYVGPHGEVRARQQLSGLTSHWHTVMVR